MPRYISFDIEIVKEIPTGTDDWTSLRPLGISVASTLDSVTGQVDLWYHGMDQKTPLGGAMDQAEAQRLVNYLYWAQEEQGRPILTWNGLSFDFDVLAEESGMWAECQQLARHHVDMMLQFFCMKGYAVGLEAVSKGLGLAGKTEGMHGDLAPSHVGAGQVRNRDAVRGQRYRGGPGSRQRPPGTESLQVDLQERQSHDGAGQATSDR